MPSYKYPVNFSNWSLSALLEEWWNTVTGDNSSAIADKIMLSQHFGLRVKGYGETPDLHFDPQDEQAFRDYRILEEVFTRFSDFPKDNNGSYTALNDSRAYVQWSLMTMYNIGFRCALKAVKQIQPNSNEEK